MGAAHGRDSFGCDTEEALRTAAAFRGRIAAVGLDVPLGLQAIQGGIDGPDGHLTLGAEFNLLPHGDSIGLISQAEKCQDNDVLKFAEVIAISHFLYNIDQIALDGYDKNSPVPLVVCRTGNKCWVPHISLVFREMWDTTALSL